MASKRRFEFELYRLNVADTVADLFDQGLLVLSGDDEAIISVIRNAVSPEFSYETETKRASYRWDVRDFVEYESKDFSSKRLISVSLARSIISEVGDVVTDDGIVPGTSQSLPPRADHIELIFHMARHLVAVERYTVITQSLVWRKALHEIFEQSSRAMGYRGRLELEPVPREEEIMAAFRSFDRLTRLRMCLRIPNPELSRTAQSLYEEMEDGGVREYLVDMRNSKGLNREQGKLPHSSVEIAQAGYKKGTVSMEGIRDGKRDRAETGSKAARGDANALRDYVRGMKDNARAKETKNALKSILVEMDRISPPPEAVEGADRQ